MTDFCFNALKIQSKSKEIVNAIKAPDTDFDFNKVIPMPEELVGTIADPDSPNSAYAEMYGFDNWCDWTNANWNTKWNALDTEVQGDTVCFLTADNPPVNVLKALSKQYPDVKFVHYYDMHLYEGPGYKTVYLNGRPGKRKRINNPRKL